MSRPQIEVLNIPAFNDAGWYKQIQLAVNGVPCVPFDELAENRPLAVAGRLRRPHIIADDPWLDYLAGRAQVLIDTFGDARDPKPLGLEQSGAVA